jgi:hypothetical protein
MRYGRGPGGPWRKKVSGKMGDDGEVVHLELTRSDVLLLRSAIRESLETADLDDFELRFGVSIDEFAEFQERFSGLLRRADG